jgi:O-acetyl-ADP-ribose deacetylase (regulator of RNase III)
MIEYKNGDILKEYTEALVNTVNCVGVMGRGIALQFKNSFPDNYKAYKEACDRSEMQPGKMFVFNTGYLTNPKYIINFPTKRHWKGKSRIEDIEAGLKSLVDTIIQYNIKSIAIPPLGSGLGGLNWIDVKPIIELELNSLKSVHIVVYEPNGAPDSDVMVHTKEVPKMTVGRAILIELIDRYLDGLLDPFITLLEIHKLMYFMQEAGEPLRLNFQKGKYGPYAENLRHVMNAIEGHFISGYADGGDFPNKQIKLIPGAVEDANFLIEQHPDAQSRLEQVSQLVEGFESPFGLELLSTVTWLMKNQSYSSINELIKSTYSWNAHKKQFTERQITLAVEVVKEKSWLMIQ